MAPTPQAPLLAFDTSTERLAVAACGPRGTHTVNAAGGAAASAQLLPQIAEVLGRAGLAWRDLAAIAFGRGPGAFTGLRTSCAVAQGLAFGLGCPVLPLDSLLVVADDALAMAGGPLPGAALRVAVAMDARMDEIYGGVYEHRAHEGGAHEAGWRTLRAPALHSLAGWNLVLKQQAEGLALLAGSALAAFEGRLHRPPGVTAQPVETDRAAALLRLACAAQAAGAGVDAAQALPLYLRDKVALTTAERAAAAAGMSAGTGAGAAA